MFDDSESCLQADTSRRRFLQQVGLGSSALGLSLLGGLALSQTAVAVCEPPGSPGTPTRWRHDCRSIRPRRPASTLNTTEIQKLKNAYQAMRALDTSDPNDPRGFQRQANVHCWYCGHGTQVHGSWQFFVWHRAYLYFHERILGKLINDPDFRLPYWDWDVASHRKLPGAHTSPNNAGNPLWNATRVMTPTDELPEEDVGQAVMEAALTAGTFAEFGGTATSSGIPEGVPHGSVHVDVGGDMGYFDTAGRDPVFYAHHANVDKMWSDWNKAASTHTNPIDPAFLNLTWNFYDENKAWRSITAAQVLNHEAQLRYVYGPSTFAEILPCIFDWIIIRTDWRVSHTIKLATPMHQRMLQTVKRRGRVRLHIPQLSVPLDKSAVYRLYLNEDAAKGDKGPGGDDYLGTFAVVLNERKGQHNHQTTRNVVIPLTGATVDALGRTGPKQQLVFVERGAKQKNVIPVRAGDVHFSLADLE